jgi:alpha-D-ribose 1-methylphosphonate 5-triphosphate synthase subunit PhnL
VEAGPYQQDKAASRGCNCLVRGRAELFSGAIEAADRKQVERVRASGDGALREISFCLTPQCCQGVAMVAIVHDDEIRHLIADRIVDVTSFAVAA